MIIHSRWVVPGSPRRVNGCAARPCRIKPASSMSKLAMQRGVLSIGCLVAIALSAPRAARAAESTEDRRVSALADKLPSPCGAAHSLKKSAEAGCKRTPFAMGYIERLIKRYGASDDDVTQLYRLRYTPDAKPATFDVKDTPYEGNPKAPVVIVEFFDYGCPHCREAMPILDELLLAHPRDVVLYYKQFPLAG